MSMESIPRKRWMKKSNNTATKGVPRNRHRHERINSGDRSGNEGGSLDGSADALQLHTVTRKDCRVILWDWQSSTYHGTCPLVVVECGIKVRYIR